MISMVSMRKNFYKFILKNKISHDNDLDFLSIYEGTEAF